MFCGMGLGLGMVVVKGRSEGDMGARPVSGPESRSQEKKQDSKPELKVDNRKGREESLWY